MVNVLITQPAYEQILIHMLQYGNKNSRKIQEVFGVLYGIRSGENITIQKAVPVKHGPDCEKAFTETDMITLGELDQKNTQEGLEVFGYYSSHPKMGFYLSQNEIKNLAYFIQEKKNPAAVALICDHAPLEEKDHMGIQAFNLKNPDKGANSDFQQIPVEIQAPQGMHIFKTLKMLIERSQERKPFVEEQGSQIAADDSLWDSFGDSESPEDKEKAKLRPMLEALKADISNVESSFIAGALEAYNKFLNDLADFVPKVMNDPSTDIVNMRINMEDGFRNLLTWFKQSLISQGDRIQAEYARTIQMVQDGHDESTKTIKRLLIALRDQYKMM
jgi:proteasome lid subunit RPN8/RPN11